MKSDGQFLYELAAQSGLFRAKKLREKMAATMPEFGQVFVPRPLPVHAH
jgi:hypothetical protein